MSYHAAAGFTSTNLSSPYSLALSDRKYLLWKTWSFPPTQHFEGLDVYFANYEKRCRLLPDEKIGSLTHQHAIDAFKVIVDGNNTRKKCVSILAGSMPMSKLWNAEDLADECILFIGHALLLVDLSRWPYDCCLRTFLHETLFSGTTPTCERIVFKKSFCMQHLCRIAGFEVEWTLNLDRHLALLNDDTKVSLFHGISILDVLDGSPVEIYPKELFREVRRTLSLLIPGSDKRTKRWFRSEQRRHTLDSSAVSCEYLRFEDRTVAKFNIWRERLLTLREAYEEHEPEGLMQLWLDKRRSTQWYAFWIAFLVFIIAVIQCVQGALQVYKAYNPST